MLHDVVLFNGPEQVSHIIWIQKFKEQLKPNCQITNGTSNFLIAILIAKMDKSNA